MRGVILALLGVLALPPGVAGAQAWELYDYRNLQLRGLGVELGQVWPTEIEPAYTLGVRADMGFVGPHLRLVPAIRYWSSALRQGQVEQLAAQIVRLCERQPGASCPGSLELGTVRRSDLELGVGAHYVFGDAVGASPYAGGGLGLHLLNGRGEFIDGTFVEDLLDTVAPGLDLLGGLHLPLGSSLTLLGEARIALTSDVQFANLVLGGSWTLPVPPANPRRAALARKRP